MLVTPPCGASSNIALWRAKIKPPVELVVGDLVLLARMGKYMRKLSACVAVGTAFLYHIWRRGNVIGIRA